MVKACGTGVSEQPTDRLSPYPLWPGSLTDAHHRVGLFNQMITPQAACDGNCDLVHTSWVRW